jgi:hypothetical protein
MIVHATTCNTQELFRRIEKLELLVSSVKKCVVSMEVELSIAERQMYGPDVKLKSSGTSSLRLFGLRVGSPPPTPSRPIAVPEVFRAHEFFAVRSEKLANLPMEDEE